MRPETIDDVLGTMDRIIDRSAHTGDARGWFAVVYRAVTARVRDGIAAGEYDDPERMARFDVRFARAWLDAHDAWDRRAPVSASWACAFDAAKRPGVILQHVLLGMNAHINLDLGVAAAATCPGDEIDALRDDFERINGVLAELVDQMQAAIADVSPVTRTLDVLALRVDEALVERGLAHARGRSWAFARELAAAGAPPAMVDARDREVAAWGAWIARPGAPLRWALPVIRRRERADLAGVAAALRARGADLPG